MDAPDLRPALELTAAMHAAAADDDWPTVATLAGQRHAALQAALAGDAWRLDQALVAQLRDMLAADRALAARAADARRHTVAALQELRGGRRMQDAYAAQAVGA
ncbi:hypothetical protein [Immundisolibacter sp.]|uniref:hypothetical protein n=1 Tax=Immundisolibacter sp. TaxID=1934948 RepID=UPI00261B336A|nr:hypothetical protein [Immundisolibacter sp.]MDD3650268.1 hypothetical protein [Immundisolibacter sp.]